MGRKGFEGWYFKHQKGSQMLAFIPGRSGDGAFVQMISSRGSRQILVPGLTVEEGRIRAGDCLFSESGCRINLPGVSGKIAYGPWQKLRSDIMGPFRFFPMECRHGVLSMGHSLRGGITIDGEYWDFDGGTGYAEMDSGVSFPDGYLWVQCNTFPEPCALMAAVAKIPFCGLHFRGCICALLYRGREYCFATYRGVKILQATAECLRLTQRRLRLEIDMEAGNGYSLASPVKGTMSGRVRECCNGSVRVRLWEGKNLVLDLSDSGAACEFVAGTGKEHGIF